MGGELSGGLDEEVGHGEGNIFLIRKDRKIGQIGNMGRVCRKRNNSQGYEASPLGYGR
jgi:hypothetical protein